jgi:hypothetical protein
MRRSAECVAEHKLRVSYRLAVFGHMPHDAVFFKLCADFEPLAVVFIARIATEFVAQRSEIQSKLGLS